MFRSITSNTSLLLFPCHLILFRFSRRKLSSKSQKVRDGTKGDAREECLILKLLFKAHKKETVGTNKYSIFTRAYAKRSPEASDEFLIQRFYGNSCDSNIILK